MRATNNDIWVLLERIDDPDLLLTLACDFVERVANLTPDEAQTRAWIEATRAWRDSPAAADAATRAYRRAKKPQTFTARMMQRLVRAKTGKALEAVRWAALAPSLIETPRTAEGLDVREAAKWAATWSVNASEDPSAERDWQRSHTRELACTCSAPYKPLPDCPRSRRSLLASPDRLAQRLLPETEESQ